MGFLTAGEIINDVAVELGLEPADIEDPYVSTKPHIVRLRRMLKSVGRKIVGEHDWSPLRIEGTVTIATGSGVRTYAMPSGFKSLASEVWNDTTDTRLFGPVTPNEWNRLKTGVASAVAAPVFTIVSATDPFLYVYNGTAGTLSFWYNSYFWHDTEEGFGGPVAESPAASADAVYLDPGVVVLGLKHAWLVATGMPTATEALAEYERALAKAKGTDAMARSRHLLVGGGQREPRMLDESNIPETGFGS